MITVKQHNSDKKSFVSVVINIGNHLSWTTEIAGIKYIIYNQII